MTSKPLADNSHPVQAEEVTVEGAESGSQRVTLRGDGITVQGQTFGFTIDGALRFLVMNTGLVLQTGSALNPAISFIGNQQSGLFYDGATDSVGFSIEGSERLRANATAVSLGTLRSGGGSAASPSLSFTGQTNGGIWADANTVNVSTEGVNRLAISSSGVVASVPVRAASGSVSSPGLGFGSSTSTGLYYTADSGVLDQSRINFAIGGDVRAQLDAFCFRSHGSIIGRANSDQLSPQYQFSGVVNTGLRYQTSTSSMHLTRNGIDVLSSYATETYFGYNTGSKVVVGSSGTLVYDSTGTAPLQVLSTGTVIKGTNMVNRIAMTAEGSDFFNGSGVVKMQVLNLQVNTAHLLPLADNTYQCGFSGFRWSVVYAVNGAIQTSDSTLKTFEPLPYGLAEVLQMRPVMYSWKDSTDGFKYYGLNAQDLNPILPELVYDEDPSAPMGINYAELVPVLVRSIQELTARVVALEARQ